MPGKQFARTGRQRATAENAVVRDHRHGRDAM
jgi:hypothetical protein